MRFSDASFVSHSGLKIWWGDFFFSCLAKEMKNNEIMYPGNMYNNSFMYWMGVIRIEFESSVRDSSSTRILYFQKLTSVSWLGFRW